MARILEDSSGFEQWKNSTRSTVILKRVDRTGKLVDEVVRGGHSIHLTPDERRLNQEIAATDKLDMFQNGLLTPVRLIEGTEDVEKLRENPNHMSEDDMVALLSTGRATKAFQERIANIDNPVTLKRLLEISRSEDANATVRQVEIMTARLQEISPVLYNEVETVVVPGVNTLRPSTPASGPQDKRFTP